jgi:hypothetical protein
MLLFVWRATYFFERSGKIVNFKKASDTNSSTHLFTTALVFSSSMHDRLIFKEVYKMLRT